MPPSTRSTGPPRTRRCGRTPRGRWPPCSTPLPRSFRSATPNSGDLLQLPVSSDPDEGAISRYVAHFHTVDPFVAGWRRKPQDGTFFKEDLIDPRDFTASEFFNDFARQLDVFHFLGASRQLGTEAHLTLGLHRGQRQAAFSAYEKAALDRLLPHLGRALRIARTLGFADLNRAMADDVLAHTQLAAIVVTATLQILRATPRAEALLAAGAPFAATGRRLALRDPRHHARLAQAIRDALGVGPRAPLPLLSLPRQGHPPLTLLPSPMRHDLGQGWIGPSVLLLIHNPAQTPTTAGLSGFARLHGLTPAETALLGALLAGERLATHAERAGVTINTVKTQLQQVFAKTGTHRQAELIRAVLTNPLTRFA